ncbi:hypothetical protein ABZY58_11590 [Micromonospora tulbaghiae]|uniref:hypothetical protein n=1 Tax=Micromonospora tulbaghiae TaxID=479978 RepID=UPI0033BD471F
MTLRQRLARRLRFLADRIDYDDALVPASMSFTYEHQVGVRIRHDGRGCPLWHRPADLQRAHDEADTEHVQVNWATATSRRVGGQEATRRWGITPGQAEDMTR